MSFLSQRKDPIIKLRPVDKKVKMVLSDTSGRRRVINLEDVAKDPRVFEFPPKDIRNISTMAGTLPTGLSNIQTQTGGIPPFEIDRKDLAKVPEGSRDDLNDSLTVRRLKSDLAAIVERRETFGGGQDFTERGIRQQLELWREHRPELFPVRPEGLTPITIGEAVAGEMPISDPDDPFLGSAGAQRLSPTLSQVSATGSNSSFATFGDLSAEFFSGAAEMDSLLTRGTDV